jgi:hypothetical protein
MSGSIVQMAASHPSQLYQIPGGSGSAYEAASENPESVPAPVGGRRRRHTKKAGRRHHKKSVKKTARRHHKYRK